MIDPLAIFDKLAGRYLDWRTHKAFEADPWVKENPDKLIRAEIKENFIEALYDSPGIVMLAQEADALLEKVGAENYFEFDLKPRLDRGVPWVRMTIQRGGKLSPAQKATKLERELQEIRERVLAFAGQLDAWEMKDIAQEVRDEILAGPVKAPDYYGMKKALEAIRDGNTGEDTPQQVAHNALRWYSLFDDGEGDHA